MIFFESNVADFELAKKLVYKKWLKELAGSEGFKILELSYVFMGDEELLEINRTYLNHDTYTDIITFDNSEKKLKIEGDIFISIERIKENAVIYKVGFETELRRVMAHGLLHLCGYADKSEIDAKRMREKENFYIEKYGEL